MKIIIKAAISITILLFSVTHLTAQIRYVSKTGSSTPPYTSWATASDSIQKCIEICNDGDTVIVGNGVYKETLLITKAIYLLGTSMDSTIIDGTGLNGILKPGTAIDIRNNVIVESMTLLGKGNGISSTTTIGLFNSDAVLRVYNCIVGNAYTGIGSTRSIVAENNIVKDVTVGIGGSSYLSEKPFHIKNNLILLKDSNGKGISGSNGLRFFIHNNLIISLNNSPRYGIYLDAVRSAIITNNLVSGFSTICNYDDYAPYDSTYLSNNIFTEGRSHALLQSSINISVADRTRFTNNIVHNNLYGIRVFNGVGNYDYNLFFNNNKDVYSNVVLGPNTVYQDPMFVKDTVPSDNLSFDFHLQQYSPAIDAGNPDILDVDGSRSDIGMYGGPLGEVYKYLDLAPKSPKGLTATVDSNNIYLKWKRNTEADFSHYKLYSSKSQNFTADSTTLLAELTDTSFVHQKPGLIKKLYYKLSGVDNQGNESAAGEEIGVIIVGINGEGEIIQEYRLYQNYPNPFNGTTTIPYRLKERGQVRISIYDIKGELIKVMLNKEEEAGYYEVELNGKELGERNTGVGEIASGIYLYRIEIIGSGSLPRFIDVKKMIYLK